MMRPPSPRVFGTALVAAATAAVAVGLLLVAPPSEEQAKRRDARRVADLNGIATLVDEYWVTRSQMPASIADLDTVRLNRIAADPFTNRPYEYRRGDSTTYELCATFERKAAGANDYVYDEGWSHAAGHHCYRRVARVRSG